MSATPYTPGAGDISIEMLREVFGKTIDGIVGGNTAGAESAAANMLGAAFGFFNGGVLFFGAIILTWVTVFGITNTANDGQVLGKKWSTFYTPLRTFVASAALIPSTSGYSLVQIVILMVVTWSVGFASNMWNAVVDHVVDTTTTDQIMRSIMDDKQFDKMALNAFQMEACAYGVSQGMIQTTGSQINLRLNAQYQKTQIGDSSTAYKTILDFRDPSWRGSEDICGSMVLTTTFTKPDTNRVSVNQATSTLQNEVGDMQGAIGNIRYKATVQMFSKMAPLVIELARVADSTGGDVFHASQVQAVIDQAKTQMMADIRAEVASRIEGTNQGLKDKFKEGGWVMAGSLYRELIAVKDGIQHAMATQQQYIPGSYTVDHLMTVGNVSAAITGVISRYTGPAAVVLQKLAQPDTQTYKPTDIPSLRTGFGPSDFLDGGTSVKSQVESWFNSLANRAMAGMVFYLGEDDSDPVMQVKNIGDYMAYFGETVLLTKTALVATVDGLFEGSKTAATQSILGTNMAGLMSVGPGVLKFVLTGIKELWGVVQPGVMAMLYGGYFLGMWVPMIPYYVFSLGVIGWLVQVVEALAAGSLWMVMHLTPEREDSFIGSQQQGYLLLMSLFARPPLMILGLVASMAILNPAIRFINASFITTFQIVQADSVTGLLSLAGFMLIYGVIILGVFMMVFSLPQTLPDRILRWIGAGIGDLGEQGTMSRIESSASSQARMAATAGAAKMVSRGRDRMDGEQDVHRSNTPAPTEADGARPEGHS